MRIAFYAPLKSPRHPVPSGDRLIARLLMQALGYAGHHAELVSSFRSYEGAGDSGRQAALREEGLEIAQSLVERWRMGDPAERPKIWFTYHLYYKAPDWLGPFVSNALGIPYVLAEASVAPKRALGPWAIGHEAVSRAVARADLILCPTRDDVACLRPIVAQAERIRSLPPFLDSSEFRAASIARANHREKLAAKLDLDSSVPWIVVAAMMRPGDKLASYRMLSEVLGGLTDLRWQLIVAGDGPSRFDVEALFEEMVPARARFMGELGYEELAQVYSACDMSVWPAVNEAYGMAMLEAQAAGLPVVSCATRGVPDVVCDGRTGLLAPTGDRRALADLTRKLLLDPVRRSSLGCAAAQFVHAERSIEAAAHNLDRVLCELPACNERPLPLAGRA